MSGLPAMRAPGFFWQGLLILLPVGVLAALGLLSLRQDRRLAEEEGRRRASEVVQQLALGLNNDVKARFTTVARLASEWREARRKPLLTWPGNAGNETASTAAALAGNGWQTAWAALAQGLDPESVLLDKIMLDQSGQALSLREWSTTPQPPSWFINLSDDQRAFWDRARVLQSSGAPAEELNQAWERFSQAGHDAAANAALAQLRLQQKTNSAAEYIEALCHFGESNAGIQSESGLPLSAVALALAIRQAEETGLSQTLFDRLQDQLFNSPSPLSSQLIAQSKRLGKAAPGPVQQAIRFLDQAWRHDERLRQLLQLLRPHLPLAGPLLTNLWLDGVSGRWLVLVRPERREAEGSRAAERSDQPLTSIQFVAKPLLARIFAESLQHAAIALPDFLSVEPELVGEPLPAFGRKSAGRPSQELLATASGVMTLSAPDLAEGAASPFASGQTESKAGAVRAEGPSLILRAYLADREALLARQRQRTLWAGGLILAAAGAAVVGYGRARRAYLRERQLGQLKSDFVSSVSHELRAPIASVRLMAESLARSKVTEPDKQRAYFHFIVQECRRLSALIANVLDFSRIEQGRKQYEFEPTDVARLVPETVKLMEPRAAEREVSLRFEADAQRRSGTDAHLLLDGRAVQQALLNLLDNAIKHTPKGGRVSAGLAFDPGSADSSAGRPRSSSSPSLGRCRIWVDDQGPGIPATEHEKIFERFYRVGSELRRETEGVGIGLSIVKHIVEAHHGRVLVQSKLGQGSRFTMEFPIASAESS